MPSFVDFVHQPHDTMFRIGYQCEVSRIALLKVTVEQAGWEVEWTE